MKLGCNRPNISEKKLFEIVDDGRTDDGRTDTEPAYTISSPGAFGSGEAKNIKKLSTFQAQISLECYFSAHKG